MGYVVQTFDCNANKDICVSQEFCGEIGETATFEDANHNALEDGFENLQFPLQMVQPKKNKKMVDIKK